MGPVVWQARTGRSGDWIYQRQTTSSCCENPGESASAVARPKLNHDTTQVLGLFVSAQSLSFGAEAQADAEYMLQAFPQAVIGNLRTTRKRTDSMHRYESPPRQGPKLKLDPAKSASQSCERCHAQA
jgi:hypothetical protein